MAKTTPRGPDLARVGWLHAGLGGVEVLIFRRKRLPRTRTLSEEVFGLLKRGGGRVVDKNAASLRALAREVRAVAPNLQCLTVDFVL